MEPLPAQLAFRGTGLSSESNLEFANGGAAKAAQNELDKRYYNGMKPFKAGINGHK